VVAGSRCLIDNHLALQNKKSIFHKKHRITNQDALDAAVHVASLVRSKTEGFFARVTSPALLLTPLTANLLGSISPIDEASQQAQQRTGHRCSKRELHGGQTQGGNRWNRFRIHWRRQVRPIAAHKRTAQSSQRRPPQQPRYTSLLLEQASPSLGYSASGQILNCNALDVGLHTAVQVILQSLHLSAGILFFQLKADKLICLHLDDIRDLELPNWLPLDDAFDMLPAEATALIKRPADQLNNFDGKLTGYSRLMWDFELADQSTLPSSYVVSVLSCHYGVPRSHLVDATVLEVKLLTGFHCLV